MRVLRLPPPNCENMPFSCSVISSMPGGPMISSCGLASASSISISLSSSSPSRSFLRNTWRAVLSRRRDRASSPRARGGSSTSRMRSSAASSARRAHLAHLRLARLLDRDLGQVAHDRVDVLADVAHLGELGRLHLDEGRVGQLRQAARDLGLADAGGADHQDVLGRDLVRAASRRPAGGASGCAARSPPRAWPRSGRRCGGRARRRSPGASSRHVGVITRTSIVWFMLV